MRSDYLGSGSNFRDLPECINRGLYLIPRMTRDQIEEAICGPIALASARISAPLAQRLLNDLGDSMDQLPVLQHAMLRTWLQWKGENRPGEPLDFDPLHAGRRTPTRPQQSRQRNLQRIGRRPEAGLRGPLPLPHATPVNAIPGDQPKSPL